jgi:hypothetical protein
MLIPSSRMTPVLLAGWVALAGIGWPQSSGRASEPTGSIAQKDPRPDEAGLLPAEFARVRALIRPHPGESRWAELPWESSLWEARKKAAAAGKLIFIMGAGSGTATGFC